MKKINNKLPLKGNLSKFHYSILGSLFALIIVGHFFMQMSFITKENSNFDKEKAKVGLPFEENLISPIEISEDITQEKEDKLATTDTEIVVPKKQNELIKTKPVKVVQKDLPEQSVTEKLPISKKEKSAIAVKSARLRKAEKLLTGF